MTSQPTEVRRRGVYLITGGVGGLGLIFADHLVKNYQADLILVGRSTLAEEQQRKVAALRATGSRIEYLQADLADRDSVEGMAAQAKALFGTIHGVIHAAGVIRDSFVLKKTQDEAEQVLAAKVYGTTHLDEAFHDHPLDFFILFSSVASVTGNVGQGDYAYANSFMDHYATIRESLRLSGQRHGKTVSISWPLWQEGGMPVTEQLMETMGVTPLETEAGIRAFEDALRLHAPHMIVTKGELPSTEERSEASIAQAPAPVQQENLQQHVLDYLKDSLSKAAKLPSAKIKPNVPLEKYGIDSLMILKLNNELEREFGKLSKTLFFEYQTLQELGEYFLENHRDTILKWERVAEQEAPKPPAQPHLQPQAPRAPQKAQQSVTEQDIAIIGLSGQYPMASDLDAFWENLKAGLDCIVEIPEDRWDHRRFFHPDKNIVGKSYSKWGSFVDDVDKFDPRFFNISPREAEFIDPQERLFLSNVWHTLEDAGYTRDALKGNQVGVFVGVMYGQYQLYPRQVGENTVFGDSFYASIANRVSYLFNFQGPSIALDTMCSSSLTAIHLACESIHRGECDLAVAGGVNLTIHPNKYTYLSRTKFMASDGRCKAFGEGGDGYVPGEGVGAVLLKPLSKAIADGDQIYAVIKGITINHGGKTNGYSVPNPNAQAQLIGDALRKSNVNPRAISYLEAHGTGTSLGDPIEITGLSKAWGTFTKDKQFCPIGSIKSNIGHLESAAGMASLTKVLLQMKHKQLVPSLHADRLNPNIDFETSPFYVQRELSEWKQPVLVENGMASAQPRFAAISAFGAGGSNAHLVLEEHERPFASRVQEGPHVVVLSAKNAERLGVYARNLVGYLEKHRGSLHLADVAFTLQVGREPMNDRLAMVAQDMDDLLAKLRGFLAQGETRGLFRGDVKRDRARLEDDEEELVSRSLAGRDLYRLAELWACGADVDWMALYQGGARPLRVSLPTYPFLKERCWIHDNGPRLYEPEAVAAAAHVAKLHPLLDANVSTFHEVKFLTTFSGAEPILADHQIQGRKILPGAAYLEMARAAGEWAKGEKVRKLKDVSWSRPIAVDLDPVAAYTGLTQEAAGVAHVEVATLDEAGQPKKHASVSLLFEAGATRSSRVDIDGMTARAATRKEQAECYAGFDALGVQYGSTFQVIQELYVRDTEALSRLQVPAQEDVVLNPWVIDGAFQTAAAVLGEGEGIVYLPYAIGEIEILQPLTEARYAVQATLTERRKVNLLIANEQGEVLVAIRDLFFQAKSEKRTMTPRPSTAAATAANTVYFGKTLRRAAASDLSRRPEATLLVFAKETADPGAILVQPGYAYRKLSPTRYQIDINHVDDYHCLLSDLAEDRLLPTHILHDLADREAGLDKQLESGIFSLYALVKALSKKKSDKPVRLLYAYDSSAQDVHPAFAGVSGFLKSLGKESKRITGKTVRVEGAADPVQRLNLLLAEFGMEDGQEVTVEARTGERFVPELVELPTPRQAVPLRRNGVYLITGGLGELGLLFAEYLAKQAAARVVLVGRSEPSAEKVEKLRLLSMNGAELLYLQGNVDDRAGMESLIREVKSRFGELHGIIHSAGVVRDSMAAEKNNRDIRAVFAPKVQGALVLDEVTKDENLDFVVLFSSITGLLGNFGQTDYGYANAFLDHFAAWRESLRSRGLRRGKTLSINWPLWAEGGMTVNEQTRQLLTKTMGTDVLDKEAGVAAFAAALSMDVSQMAVIKGDANVFKSKFSQTPLPAHATAAAIAPTVTVTETRHPNPVADEQEVLQAIERELVLFTSQVLKIQEKDIETDENMDSFGFDSVSITEVVNLLNAKFDLELTPADFYEYATMQAFAQGLYQQYPDRFRAERKEVERTVTTSETITISETAASATAYTSAPAAPAYANEPIAIVGMSGMMVQSKDLAEFWNHLAAGQDLITEIPADRWDWQELYGDAKNQTTAKWGGFMRRIDQFDAPFFGISPHEAKLMDPQQRLFMETVWKAIEDAGYSASDLSGTKTGVFVGVSNMDYYELVNELEDEVQAHLSTGNAHSILANRISFLLNLNGPSEPVNTACSSSLVAVHRAVESIRSGSCKMAIVGGVNVIASPRLTIAFDKAGMLSPDGRCKTFDKSANGYVRGEGVGAVMLKPLSQAEADGDHIYALIRGSAINHCGRTNSLTAPSPSGQAQVIVEALENAQVSPAHISYVEAHGTGTSLGDPIEINGLKKAFAQAFEQRGEQAPSAPYCGIGSVKTNIGHLESAAGMAGLFKVVLGMKNGQIPKSVHMNEVNPYISLHGSPFYLCTETSEWQHLHDAQGRAIPRLAGISSFGFGGANAHVIVEEYQAPAAPSHLSARDAEHVFVLSARTPERLQQYARNMLDFLRGQERPHQPAARTGNSDLYRREMAQTVADILKVDASELSLTDEFLDCGFDPLTLNELATRVRDAYDVEMNLDLLSSCATVQGLAEHLSHQLAGGTSVSAKESVPAAPLSLSDLCYTLQVGREASKVRMALVVTSMQDLIDQLTRYVQGEPQGPVPNRLGQQWLDGAKVDWKQLHAFATRKRLPLPTYPFEEISYWIRRPEKKRATIAPAPVAVENVAPNETKAKIRDILASILSQEPSAIEDHASFTELGLDSIMGIALVKRLNQAFRQNLNPMKILENSTLQQLTDFMSAQIGVTEATPAPAPAAANPVQDKVRDILANLLSMNPADLDEHADFATLGLDSILGIQFVKNLNQAFRQQINPMKTVENATLHKLSAYIAEITQKQEVLS